MNEKARVVKLKFAQVRYPGASFVTDRDLRVWNSADDMHNVTIGKSSNHDVKFRSTIDAHTLRTNLATLMSQILSGARVNLHLAR